MAPAPFHSVTTIHRSEKLQTDGAVCVRASDFGNNGNAKHNMEVTGATRFVPKVHLDGAMIRARHPLYDLGNCSARKGIASETAGLSCIH